MSVDNVGAGLLVMRIPLSQIGSSSTIGIGYTTPSDSASAYGGHLTQNVGDTAYWAGHVDNRTMRIFSMKDSENVYAGATSGSTAGNGPLVQGSGGTDWLASISGKRRARFHAARLQSELWFVGALAARSYAGNLPVSAEPHPQIEVLRGSDFTRSVRCSASGVIAFAINHLCRTRRVMLLCSSAMEAAAATPLTMWASEATSSSSQQPLVMIRSTDSAIT